MNSCLQHLFELPDDLAMAPPPRPVPQSTPKTAAPVRLVATMPNPTLHVINENLQTYQHNFLDDPKAIRRYTVARLLEESRPSMPPTVRLKALEALGKIEEVGLFAERTEITIKQEPTEALEARLRARIAALMPKQDIVDVTPTYDQS